MQLIDFFEKKYEKYLMVQPPRRPNEFPADQFCHDVKRIEASQIEGGWRGREDELVLRCVFPAFDETAVAVRHPVDVALMIYRSGVQHEIVSAMLPQLTLKGIGAFEPGGRIDSYQDVAMAGARVAEDAGFMGGVMKLASSVSSLASGVIASDVKRLRLEANEGLMGKVSAATKLLDSAKYLKRRGLLPPEGYDPGFNQIVYTKFVADFTAEQVAAINNNANNVPEKYGKKPRLVARFNYPERLFRSTGHKPEAAFLLSVQQDKSTRQNYYQPVRMKPVEYLSDE